MAAARALLLLPPPNCDAVVGIPSVTEVAGCGRGDWKEGRKWRKRGGERM